MTCGDVRGWFHHTDLWQHTEPRPGLTFFWTQNKTFFKSKKKRFQTQGYLFQYLIIFQYLTIGVLIKTTYSYFEQYSTKLPPHPLKTLICSIQWRDSLWGQIISKLSSIHYSTGLKTKTGIECKRIKSFSPSLNHCEKYT